MFLGSFNRQKNFTENDFIRNNFGEVCTLDRVFYDAVSSDIKGTVGDFREYSAEEIYRYFYCKYGAFCIDLRFFYNYYDLSVPFCGDKFTVSDDRNIEILREESGKYFCYLRDGKFSDEKNITIVIDGIRCGLIDKNSGCKDSIIIVIGTFDGVNVNSMKVILSPGIPQIEYALEFFRTHSGDGKDIFRRICGEVKCALGGIYASTNEVKEILLTDDTAIFGLDGYGEHNISVKLTLFPSPSISFYGYDREDSFVLTSAGIQNVRDLCCNAMYCGGMIEIYCENECKGRIEFMDVVADEEQIRQIYLNFLSSYGKYPISGTRLIYSNFDGSKILKMTI